MESKKLSVKQNMLYNTIGSFVYLFCQWLITIVVVWFSNYENAGILSLAMSVNNIFFTISTFGLKHYQVSDIENKYNDIEYVVTRCITCLSSTFICLLFVLINSTHYSFYQSACIIVYFVFKISESFIDVFQGIQQKKYRMDFVGKSYIIRGILTLLSFTATIKLTGDLMISLLAMTLLSILITLAYDFNICKKLSDFSKKIDWKKICLLLKENFPLMINAVFMTGMVSVARFFLELYVGEEILGIYSSIATPTVIIQTACNMIYVPLVTEYAVYYSNKDEKSFKKLIFQVCGAFLAIFVVCTFGVLLLGNFGLKLLFGAEILKYSYLLLQTMIVTFMVAVMYWLSAILVVERKQKLVMVINGVAILLNIIISMIMIPIYKIEGINYVLFIVLAVDILLLTIAVWWTTNKHFKY
ncbi:MAG: lipopolysaccharide biosynthesis protein [Lachnospiraceae bacterium]|nr:lipopolysaccharide biosynthesis protein [Lachnospiraceae bacterium]